MSSNFSWFLRIILYIPLSIAILFIMTYNYLTNQFEKNFNTCLISTPISQTNKSPRQVANFVGCLKSKGNFFVSRIMREERLYQMVQPKIQCEFIGKWYVSEGYKEYWLSIMPDSRFKVEPMLYSTNGQQPVIIRQGIWSSSDKNTAIQFFDEEYFWPINEYKVKWLSDKHFSLTNILTDQYAYFYRNSPVDESCVEQKIVKK